MRPVGMSRRPPGRGQDRRPGRVGVAVVPVGQHGEPAFQTEGDTAGVRVLAAFAQPDVAPFAEEVPVRVDRRDGEVVVLELVLDRTQPLQQGKK